MSGVDIADQLIVYYACSRRTLKWYKRIFWRMVEHVLINAYILFKLVQKPNLRVWTQKFSMELAYQLTAALIADRIGQRRTSPSSQLLTRLKGKHFVYYHEKRVGCVVCAYKSKQSTARRERTPKPRTIVPNVMCMCAMANVLRNIIHL